jgi:hypothetical protein
MSANADSNAINTAEATLKLMPLMPAPFFSRLYAMLAHYLRHPATDNQGKDEKDERLAEAEAHRSQFY